jgi:pantothenate kinase type III
MLLTIDVGNSNTVLGVFRGEELIANWRLTTEHAQTVDEYGVLTRSLLSLANLDQKAIAGVMISSVVPPVNWTLGEMARVYFGQKALFVELGVKTGMAVLVDNPSEVGADRIVNGVAAFHKYGGPCIVVDFGTAITFDAISAKGEYLGGVICPGVQISADALFQRAARLPRIEWNADDETTNACMRSLHGAGSRDSPRIRPQRRPAAPGPTANRDASAPRTRRCSGGNPMTTILIAEDESSIRDLIQRRLLKASRNVGRVSTLSHCALMH